MASCLKEKSFSEKYSLVELFCFNTTYCMCSNWHVVYALGFSWGCLQGSLPGRFVGWNWWVLNAGTLKCFFFALCSRNWFKSTSKNLGLWSLCCVLIILNLLKIYHLIFAKCFKGFIEEQCYCSHMCEAASGKAFKVGNLLKVWQSSGKFFL